MSFDPESEMPESEVPESEVPESEVPESEVPESEMEAPLGLLADLPPVEPPEDFYAGLITRRRRRGLALIGGGVVLSGLVWAAVVAATSGVTGDAAPDLDFLVARHEGVVEADGTELVADAEVESFAPMEAEEMPAPFQAPDELAGALTMSSGFHDSEAGIAHLVYVGGERIMSVFELPGELDTSGLDQLESLSMGDDQAWEHEAPPFRAIVLRRADLVYVVVGEGQRDDMAGAMEDLPDARPMGASHRLRDAMEDIVNTFAFG